MPKPYVKPDDRSRTTYVTVTDRRTRKSKHVTVYGLTPTQVVDVLRKAVNELSRRDDDEAQDAA